MAEAGLQLEGLKIVEGSAYRIAHENWDSIRAVRHLYYEKTLRSRTSVEVTHFVEETSEDAWSNPNLSPRSRSRYARPMAIAAFRGGHMTQVVMAANNASTDRPGMAGMLEEELKLHLPVGPLLEARYVAIREIIGDENEVVVAAMTAHLLKSYRRKQPVTDYTFSDEDKLRGTLNAWGFRPDGEPEQVPDVYGANTQETQQRMLADSVGEVIDTIMALPGAQDALDYINRVTTYDSGSSSIVPLPPMQF